MNINKVQPIQYTPYEYWKKYKPYAHKILGNYTADKDLHDNISSSLYFMFCKICSYINYSKYPISYIKEAIKLLVYRLLNYNGYKYHKSYIAKKRQLLEENLVTNLDTTLDDYLLNKQVNKLISDLPENHKLILLMHFGVKPYNKMTIKEIAKRLNMTFQNVSKLEKSALKELKKKLNTDKCFSTNDFIMEQKQNLIPVDIIKEMVSNKSKYRVEDFKYV